jgi:hypothetical protein
MKWYILWKHDASDITVFVRKVEDFNKRNNLYSITMEIEDALVFDTENDALDNLEIMCDDKNTIGYEVVSETKLIAMML